MKSPATGFASIHALTAVKSRLSRDESQPEGVLLRKPLHRADSRSGVKRQSYIVNPSISQFDDHTISSLAKQVDGVFKGDHQTANKLPNIKKYRETNINSPASSKRSVDASPSVL